MTTLPDGRHYIGGQWLPSSSGDSMPATNPATTETLATLAAGGPADVDAAVAAAAAAFARHRSQSIWERAELCERVADELTRQADRVAEVLCLEQGKPLVPEAIGEVRKAALGYRNAAAHAKHLQGRTIPVPDVGKRVHTIRQPRGVYAVVTPWNFPINIPTEYLAPALATGNTVVWVPAPTTSLCAIALAEVFEAAGVPPGVINVVTGEGPIVGDAAIRHPAVQGIGFTGSGATGSLIAERAAGKPMLLELGGNGPTIVFDDANLELAADGITRSAFTNAGQICSATELVLAERSIAEQLTEACVARARAVRLGDPRDPDTTMGPLNNEKVATKMDDHIADALQRGGKIRFGGGRAEGLDSPLFYQPTVISEVSEQATLVTEESFGPIIPIIAFDTEEQVLELADAPQFGLAASVWSRNAGRAIRTAEALRAGVVNINEGSSYWELHVPFGGGAASHSGNGRIGGIHTLEAMTELKTISVTLDGFS